MHGRVAAPCALLITQAAEINKYFPFDFMNAPIAEMRGGCNGVGDINITEMGNPWPVAYREFAKASNT